MTAVGEDELLGTAVLGAFVVPGTGKAGVAVDPEMMGHDFCSSSSLISDGQRFPGFDGGDGNWVERGKDSKILAGKSEHPNLYQ